MPEAFACLLVFFVCVAVYIGARFKTNDPLLQDARQELAVLRHRADWLEQRLGRAARERWDDEMEQRLLAELIATRDQIAAYERRLG